MVAVVLLATEVASPAELRVREVGEGYDAKHIEIRGVAARAFDPALWEAGLLNLLPDIRRPILAPREGKHRNIYAPSIVQTKAGWRIYYGGWDGVDTPNDRIYACETTDFAEFTDRRTVIEHGEFQHVCNVNVTPTGRGGFAMMCTAYPDAKGTNKPVTFFSADGEHWNGASGPFPATRQQIVSIDGYDHYADADINGVNVLLFDSGTYRIYFSDFHNFGKVFRASGNDGKHFRFDGTALEAPLMVNDVKKLHIGEHDVYLMGLHRNGDRLFYSLSSGALHFTPAKEMWANRDDADRYMVSIGWVTADQRVLGFLYGAGAKGSLDQNRIFATWLQRKAVIIADGKRFEAAAALGPDRQLIPADAPIRGAVELFGEDGRSLLSRGEVFDFKPGRAYAIETQQP